MNKQLLLTAFIALGCQSSMVAMERCSSFNAAIRYLVEKSLRELDEYDKHKLLQSLISHLDESVEGRKISEEFKIKLKLGMI